MMFPRHRGTLGLGGRSGSSSLTTEGGFLPVVKLRRTIPNPQPYPEAEAEARAEGQDWDGRPARAGRRGHSGRTCVPYICHMPSAIYHGDGGGLETGSRSISPAWAQTMDGGLSRVAPQLANANANANANASPTMPVFVRGGCGMRMEGGRPPGLGVAQRPPP